MPVLVLGSTGNVGPHVVAELARAGTQARVITRDAAHAAEILPAGTQFVEGDLGHEKIACT